MVEKTTKQKRVIPVTTTSGNYNVIEFSTLCNVIKIRLHYLLKRSGTLLAESSKLPLKE